MAPKPFSESTEPETLHDPDCLCRACLILRRRRGLEQSIYARLALSDRFVLVVRVSVAASDAGRSTRDERQDDERDNDDPDDPAIHAVAVLVCVRAHVAHLIAPFA